jgi:hypothetical protein
MTIGSIAKPPDPTWRLPWSSRRGGRFHREDIVLTHFSLNGAATSRPSSISNRPMLDARIGRRRSVLAVIEPDMRAARETEAVRARSRTGTPQAQRFSPAEMEGGSTCRGLLWACRGRARKADDRHPVSPDTVVACSIVGELYYLCLETPVWLTRFES